MPATKFGVFLPISGRAAGPATLMAAARKAEAWGYASVWAADRIVIPWEIKTPYPYSADQQFIVPPDRPFLEPLPMIRSSLPRRAGAGAAVAVALVMTFGLATPALASANVEGLLQNVVDMLTGNTARLLAILAVVVVGILWMFGLFDLRRAAIVVLGIVVVFGAAEIVNLITGGA